MFVALLGIARIFVILGRALASISRVASSVGRAGARFTSRVIRGGGRTRDGRDGRGTYTSVTSRDGGVTTIDTRLDSSIAHGAALLEPALGAVVAKTANEIANRARDLAPVETGTLRDSIEVAQIGPLEWEVQVTAPYATFVEYGSTHQPAHPFLTPAAEAVRGEFIREATIAIQRCFR